MRVFINHHTTDDTFVSQLAGDLHDYGVSTWVDHHDINPNDDWGQELLDSLRACDMMIVVLSPQAAASIPLRDQWQHHLDQGKPIVVVIAQSSAIPPELSEHPTIDLTETTEQNLLHVLRALGINMPTQPLNAEALYHHMDETGLSLDTPTDQDPS